MVVKESRAGRGCCGGTLLGHSQVTSCCCAWCLVFKLEIVRVRLKCINTGKELATGLAAEAFPPKSGKITGMRGEISPARMPLRVKDIFPHDS